MRASETKTIRGVEVTSTKLPTMRGHALRFKLGKLLVPVLGGFRGKKLDDVMKLDLADLQPVLAPLLGQLDEKTIDALMLEILVCTYVTQKNAKTGEPFNIELTSGKFIDLAFDGDVDALWASVWFALEVNLKGSFVASAEPEQQSPTP